MLHHKIWSSQIRTTLCEEHSESPIRHRLKLPKTSLCLSVWRFLHFGPTEIIKLIWVFNLGGTNLNFSVTPICCNCTQLCISVPPSCSTRSHRQGRAIYSHGQNFGNFSETLRPWIYILLDPVGVSEWNNLMSPKCITVFSFSKSVRPKSSNRLHRDWKLRSTWWSR